MYRKTTIIKNIIPALLVAMVGLLPCGCTAEQDPLAEYPVQGEDVVPGIAVEIAAHDYKISTRADGDGEDPAQPGEGEGEGDGEDTPAEDKIDYTEFDIDKLTPYKLEFNENSILQISQKTRSQDPFLTAEDTYDFAYIPDTYPDDAWSQEAIYNFRPYDADEPLKWNKISEKGTFFGGYALYGMYFPIENKLRQKMGEEGRPIYSVMEDQSTRENLIKSDILGACHITSYLFTKLRFRLFHLMTYVRIRLFVPVYKDELNTGYRNGALQYATLNNVTPDFAIDWNAVRSSDNQGPLVTALSGNGTIKMYQHPLEGDATEYPKTEIRYKDYIPDEYFDQGLGDDEYDEVRVYDFSVIIPIQQAVEDENGNQQPLAGTDFLSFYFRSNSGATTRYNFNQALRNPNTDGDIALNQGVYQFLQLYIPRVGNKVVYVGAKVSNWDQMGTEMLLTPEEE